MSQIIEKIKNAVKFKSGESTSSKKVQSWTVRDSRPCRNRMTNNYATGTFTGLIALSAIAGSLLLVVPPTYADTASSITITPRSGDVTLNLTPTSKTGTFAASNAVSFSVTSNHYTGYTLSITGANDTGNLAGATNNLASITAATTAGQSDDDFSGTSTTAQTTYNDHWGFLPSKYCTGTTASTCSNNTNYLKSPLNTTATVLDVTDAANATPNSYTFQIGARATTDTVKESYSQAFTVIAVGNANAYSITYADNSGEATGMPTSSQTGSLSGSTVTLVSTAPTRENYTFKGWCSVSTNDDTCTSNVIYNPDGGGTNLDYTFSNVDETVLNSATVYAMWAANSSGGDTIQDLDLASCQVNVGTNGNPSNVGDELTVTDSRDGKEYTVRYINGACWMTQNLAIEPDTKMTADDTNITSAQYNNSTYYALPSTNHDLKTNGSSTTDNCYGIYSNSTYSGKGWTEACTHVATDTDVSDVSSQYTKEQLGAWYNYAAATAGTITGASDNTTADTYNICPKGWTLPVRNTSSPAGSTNSVVSYASSFNPLYGGNYVNGSRYLATTYGIWWSATAYNGRNRYTLRYESGSLNASSGYSRYIGLYVRCIRTS